MHDQLHPLPLASATRFRIRHAYPVSFVIEANGCGYAQGPFWLPWRFALVGQGNQIKDVRFLFSPFSPLATPPLWPPKREDNTVSAERSMKFGNIVWVEISRYLIKITTLKVLAAKHTASLQLLCTVGGNQARLDARTEFKNLEPSPKGGVEAGRAHHCIYTQPN